MWHLELFYFFNNVFLLNMTYRDKNVFRNATYLRDQFLIEPRRFQYLTNSQLKPFPPSDA